jgi:hypothetical protein
MKTYLVQLETQDDGVSVRDKMGWAQPGRILLLWPRRGRCRLRVVDWVLIRRTAFDLGCQIGLVTKNVKARQDAQQAGIATFESAQEAQSVVWRQGRRLRRRRWKRDPQQARQLLAAWAQRPSLALGPTWLRWAALGLGVFAVLALIVFLLPKAEVTLQPAIMQQSVELEVWADPHLSFAMLSGGMPARRLEVLVEGRAEMEASGVVQAASANASGLVTLTNLTETAVYVPAGLVVLTLDEVPVRLQTLRSVTLPAGVGQSVDVAVQALTPGSAGNVAAGAVQAVEGALGARLLVHNQQAILGGQEVQRPAPDAADFVALRQRLMEDLRLQAIEELKRGLMPGQRLVEGSVSLQTVVGEVAQPEVGVPAETASLTLQVVFEGWSVAEEDLRMAARTALDVNLSPGYVANDETLTLIVLADAQRGTDGVWHWPIRAQRTVRGAWSATELALALVGQPLSDVPDIVAGHVALSASPQVRVTPNWWGRMPVLAVRIVVRAEE